MHKTADFAPDLEELDDAIENATEQLKQLMDCMATLRQNLADLRRIRRGLADLLSPRELRMH